MNADLSIAYRRYGLGLMTAVYTLNLVDRGLINLLLQPIKDDLELSDTQLGLVTGIAFSLFYATLGIPLARWADRGDRVTITAVAIGLWGVTVMACLAVGNYVQLVMARVGAAVGEAGCKPPTYSLVGDYFPAADERTSAMAVYWLGSPFAAIISYVVGGWLNQHYSWRWTFFLMGMPGLALAVLVKLSLTEPRARRPREESRKTLQPSFGAVLTTLWRQRATRHLTVALTLVYTIAYGLNPWYAAFMIRSHAMGTAELGLWLGAIFGAGGIGGIMLGGYVSSRFFRESERRQMRSAAAAMLLLLPCFLAFLLVPGRYPALIALLPLQVVFNFFFAPTFALLQRLVPDAMRATTLSVVMLLANLVGMGLGPQIVGALSDAFAPATGAESLRYAMLSVAFIAPWAAFHYWRVGEHVARDLAWRAA